MFLLVVLCEKRRQFSLEKSFRLKIFRLMTALWDETTLPTIISNYKLEGIFNADQFGLFYQALPNRTLHLKSEKCVGGKHSKTRLTGMAAANAVGKKLLMLVIGKSARPTEVFWWL